MLNRANSQEGLVTPDTALAAQRFASGIAARHGAGGNSALSSRGGLPIGASVLRASEFAAARMSGIGGAGLGLTRFLDRLIRRRGFGRIEPRLRDMRLAWRRMKTDDSDPWGYGTQPSWAATGQDSRTEVIRRYETVYTYITQVMRSASDLSSPASPGVAPSLSSVSLSDAGIGSPRFAGMTPEFVSVLQSRAERSGDAAAFSFTSWRDRAPFMDSLALSRPPVPQASWLGVSPSSPSPTEQEAIPGAPAARMQPIDGMPATLPLPAFVTLPDLAYGSKTFRRSPLVDGAFTISASGESAAEAVGSEAGARRRRPPFRGISVALPEAFTPDSQDDGRTTFRTATRLLSAAAAISMIQGLPAQRLSTSASAARGAGVFARIAPPAADTISVSAPWVIAQESVRPRSESVRQDPSPKSGTQWRVRAGESRPLPFDLFEAQFTGAESPSPIARFSRTVTAAHADFTPAGFESRMGSGVSLRSGEAKGQGNGQVDDAFAAPPYARAAALPALLAHVGRIVASLTGRSGDDAFDSFETQANRSDEQIRTNTRRAPSVTEGPLQDSHFPIFDRLASAFDTDGSRRRGRATDFPILTRDPAAMASGAVLNPVFVSLVGPETDGTGVPGSRRWGRNARRESTTRQVHDEIATDPAENTRAESPRLGLWPFAETVWNRFTRRSAGGDLDEPIAERSGRRMESDRSAVTSDGFRGNVLTTQPTWAAFSSFVRKMADRAGIPIRAANASQDTPFETDDTVRADVRGRAFERPLPTISPLALTSLVSMEEPDFESAILAALQPRILSFVQRSLRDLLPQEEAAATGAVLESPGAFSATGFPSLLRRVLTLPSALATRPSSGLSGAPDASFWEGSNAASRRVFHGAMPERGRREEGGPGSTPFVQRISARQTLSTEALRRHDNPLQATTARAFPRSPSRVFDGDAVMSASASRFALPTGMPTASPAPNDLAGDVESAVRHLWEDIPQRQQIIQAAVRNLPMPERYTPDIVEGASWPDGHRRGLSTQDRLRPATPRATAGVQTVRPLAMALPVPAPTQERAADEVFAVQRVESGGQSAASSPSQASQQDTNLASQEKGAAANDVHLLANEVWSMLKRRMETEAERSGRR